MHPSKPFIVLMGTGVLLVSLLGAAAVHAALAGCAERWTVRELTCLFVPDSGDIGIHLLSYAIAGMVLLGAFSAVMLGRRQWVELRLLIRNLTLLHAPHKGLEPLLRRLGLEDRVCLLDSEDSLCFCAGFASPRIYVSRGLVEKLTPQELEAMLLHEKHHFRNYDPLRVLSARLLVAALFFIPVLKDMLKRYLLEKEVAADRSAIRYQGHSRGLAGALQKLIQERKPVTVAVGGTEAIEYRIEHLTGHSPQHLYRTPLTGYVTSSLVAGLLLATILVPLSGSRPV